MASSVFDTYGSKTDADKMAQFIDDVTVGRIICFAIAVSRGLNIIIKNGRARSHIACVTSGIALKIRYNVTQVSAHTNVYFLYKSTHIRIMYNTQIVQK